MVIPKVTVIIPVYNPLLEYFRATLECLSTQTFKELEFLLIDDCGNPEAINIAHEFALKDSRMRILKNEKNLGSGFSRNRGISEARGEYLSFFDADDLCDVDFYEELYKASEHGNLEIIKAGVKRRFSDGREVVSTLNEFIKKGVRQKKTLFTRFRYEHWSAIYKTDFIRKNKISYGSSRTGQDTTFLLQAMYYCKKFKVIDSSSYIYILNENSVSNDKKEIFYLKHCDYLRDQIKFLNEHTVSVRDYVKYLAVRFNKDEIKTVYKKGLVKTNHPESLHIEYLTILLATLNSVKYLKQLKFHLSADMHKLINLGPAGYIRDFKCPNKNVLNRIYGKLATGFRRVLALFYPFNFTRDKKMTIDKICCPTSLYGLLQYLLYTKADVEHTLFVTFPNARMPLEWLRERFPHAICLPRYSPFYKKTKKPLLAIIWWCKIWVKQLWVKLWTLKYRTCKFYIQDEGYAFRFLTTLKLSKFICLEDGEANYSYGDSPILQRDKKKEMFDSLSRMAKIIRRILRPDLYPCRRGCGFDENVSSVLLTDMPPRELRAHAIIRSIDSLARELNEETKRRIISIFLSPEEVEKIENIKTDTWLITQPLEIFGCDEQEKISYYRNFIKEYKLGDCVIKPHPREATDYQNFFPNSPIVKGKYPFELHMLFKNSPKVLATLTSSSTHHFKNSCKLIELGKDELTCLIKNFKDVNS